MFWGCQLKEKKPYKLGSNNEESSIIHISNASLASGENGLVKAKVGGKDYLLTKLDNNN